MKKIYCDGSSLGNPGPGGWACLLLLEDGSGKQEFGHSEGLFVTNNQMELTAAIEGLQFVQPGEEVTVYSDSQYVVNCFNQKWYVKWMKNNWKTSSGGYVLNQELWEELIELNAQRQVTWVWVRGHNGNTYNEWVDKLAREQALESKNGNS